MLGRERLRMVEGRRTKRAEALRNPFRGSFESSCRRWFVFRPVIGREWWRQDTWWRTDMRGGRSVGWTGVRSDTGESVGRVKGREGGRADGGSIEQIHVAVGRTVRRPTVEHTTVGGTDGRAVRRAGHAHDQSQGSGGRSDTRPCIRKIEGTPGTNTDRCAVRVDAKKRCSSWPISGRKPAMPNWWSVALPTSSRLSQMLSKGLGSMIPASATAKDGERAEKQRR